MATPETKRVNTHRTKYFDQQPVLLEKGGKGFYKSLANLRGLTVSEMIRRAVLHDAGLNALPYPNDLETVNDLDDRQEISRKLRHLQNVERVHPEIYDALADDAFDDHFVVGLDQDDTNALLDLCEAVQKMIHAQKELPDPMAGTRNIIMSGEQIALLRRIIANREWTPIK